MINKQRVQRIRNIIYGSIFIFIFLAIIFIIALGLRLSGLMTDIAAYLAQDNSPAVSQSAEMGSEPGQQDAGVVSSQQEPTPEPSSESSAAESTAPAGDLEDEVLTDGPEEPDIAADDDPPTVINSGTGGPAGAGEYVQNTYSPSAYPDLMFDTLPVALPSAENTLYLTFDNTPSSQAAAILDVLDKHGVKATFFVWWNESMADENLRFYNQLHKGGHQIGIHSATNTKSFSELYASRDSFLNEYNEIFSKIHAETGQKTRLYRLPGGSVSPQNPQRQAVLKEIKSELDARGFLQYDWNASAQDAVVPSLSKDQILRNIENSMGDDGQVVILLHDGTGSTSTVEALDAFIDKYKKAGYSFRTLEYDTEAVSFLDK